MIYTLRDKFSGAHRGACVIFPILVVCRPHPEQKSGVFKRKLRKERKSNVTFYLRVGRQVFKEQIQKCFTSFEEAKRLKPHENQQIQFFVIIFKKNFIERFR